MTLGTILSYPNNPRTAKAKIAAAYNGLTFGEKAFDLQKDRDAEFFKKFPMGKVPVLEGGEVDLFESDAIGFYALAQKENSPLLGTTAAEKALVVQWMLFADNEISANVSGWLAPLMGYAPYMKPNVDSAIEKVKRAMDALNKVLVSRTYLVGEDITYADICVVTSLVFAYKLFFDKEMRSQYKNVTRYFNTVTGKKHFKEHLGQVQLCETPLKYVPPKKEKKPAAAPAPAAKKEKKAAAPADDEEEAPKPPPKPKSKLDLLPPSKFVMDEWKRMYSNNDPDVAMKWFWEHHDPEGYSLWKVDYKYNDELTLVFMSNNLIGGFFARLEMARKYAFGSLVVCGENNNNTISGYFLIRGQEVPFEVYDAADYGSYNFVKIEPSQYEEKKDEIYKYMAWEVEGFADGKIFK